MVKTSSICVTRLHLAESGMFDYQFMRTLSYQIYGRAPTGEILRVAGELIVQQHGLRVLRQVMKYI